MNKEFLYRMLDTMSVSGFEIPLQKKVIEEMTPVCDEIRTDCTGNVISIINPDAPYKVLLAGHIDEIGLVVTNIEDSGMLRVAASGGISAYTYPGHQVIVYGANGPVYGVVVNHDGLVKEDMKAEALYIDIGAKDGDEARKYVEPGDPAHLNTGHQELLNNCLAARAIDDRGGAFIILEALKRAKERGCQVGVYAVTTAGEETTGRGAIWAGNAIQPDVAIAVDVTYCTDCPGTKPEVSGKVALGKGPVLCNSSLSIRKVNDLLKACAREHQIPYQVETFISKTYTDMDDLHMAGTGVPTALVSFPLRYMHSPAEMCSLTDVENTIELLARFLCAVGPHTDFNPFH